MSSPKAALASGSAAQVLFALCWFCWFAAAGALCGCWLAGSSALCFSWLLVRGLAFSALCEDAHCFLFRELCGSAACGARCGALLLAACWRC